MSATLFFFLLSCRDDPKSLQFDTGAIVTDADLDGFPGETDCDDNNPDINPTAEEICDSIDNNCDGNIDEFLLQNWFADADGDSYGHAEDLMEDCIQPEGYVADNTDCDDNDADTHPNAPEQCDDIDNNCNGEIDEELTSLWYFDSDGDGYGDPEISDETCLPDDGYVSNNADCDDLDPDISPDAEEECDDIDNDCNGEIDDDLSFSWYYQDNDDDGFGLEAMMIAACYPPEGYSSLSGDCDDIDSSIHPEADEVCDYIDNNCNEVVDEDTAIDADIWYADNDGDGFGDPTNSLSKCLQPLGYISDNSDCNDGNASVYPDATEYCNGTDDNCDGNTDEDTAVDTNDFFQDNDGDGFGNPSLSVNTCYQPNGYTTDATDCDDNVGTSYPGATEYCNGTDDNCDGNTDESSAADALTWYVDDDNDNYGDPTTPTIACYAPLFHVLNPDDCDDSSGSIYPNATEYCNGADDNCNGTIDESSAADAPAWYADTDGDTYGNPSLAAISCNQPGGYVSSNTDCDDGDLNIHPNAPEICNGIDDDCDNDIDDADSNVDTSTGSVFYHDADDDSYGNPISTMMSCTQPNGYVSDSSDCDDDRNDVHPNALEICNNIDDDCDNDIDDADEDVDTSTGSMFYPDQDNDNFGSSAGLEACSQPNGYVYVSGDCDDSSAAINPSIAEYCNGTDDNCDGETDENLSDNDGDGICDLIDTETCDGIDNNGDGYGDEGLVCSYAIDSFCADDDIDIYVNGVPIYSDHDLIPTCAAQIDFTASPNDNITIYAYDTSGSCRSVENIYLLHLDGGTSTLLTAGYEETCNHTPDGAPFWSTSSLIPGLF